MKNIVTVACAISLFAIPAFAETKAETKDESNVFEIVLKDHKFTPDIIEVPAGQKFKVLVKNKDATPEEFESKDLKREKIIAANSEGVVSISPLTAGEYKFVGEYNEETAKGKIVAK